MLFIRLTERGTMQWFTAHGGRAFCWGEVRFWGKLSEYFPTFKEQPLNCLRTGREEMHKPQRWGGYCQSIYYPEEEE